MGWKGERERFSRVLCSFHNMLYLCILFNNIGEYRRGDKIEEHTTYINSEGLVRKGRNVRIVK